MVLYFIICIVSSYEPQKITVNRKMCLINHYAFLLMVLYLLRDIENNVLYDVF